MEFIFEFIKLLDEFYYFKVILVFISFIYLHLPLPLSALIIFNSVYFQEYSFIINLILINISYLSTYKFIHFMGIKDFIKHFITKKIESNISSITKSNRFIKALVLRLIIPFPILNYFFSMTNYSLKHSFIATFLSLMPMIYILSSSSKNLIKNQSMNFDNKYIFIFFIYLIIILIVNFLYKKKNEIYNFLFKR